MVDGLFEIPIGNEAHEDTTFIHIHIHGGYSVVNMQYSHAKYKHFFFSLILYILQHVAQATAMIRNESVHMHSLARAFR